MRVFQQCGDVTDSQIAVDRPLVGGAGDAQAEAPVFSLELKDALADEALEVGNGRVVRHRIESVADAFETTQIERRPGLQRDPCRLRRADEPCRCREVDQRDKDRRDIGARGGRV